MQKPNNGIKNKIFSSFLDLDSKQIKSNNLIISNTINNCPTLSVPNSDNLLNDRLKYANEKMYKYFKVVIFLLNKISLIKK
tara:strand:- start:230 stop:472 length:243 start_codon:yes stop_codon:yes gene_type:complete